MRYGILADIHGNLQALDAVLTALDGHVEGYVVAGDLVGYGPHPNECIQRIAELDPVAVAGNHDLIVLGTLSDERCIGLARASLRWTRNVLGRDERAYLQSLPWQVEAPGGVVIAHGSLTDPQEYVVTAAHATVQLTAFAVGFSEASYLVLGHTHRPADYTAAGRRLLNPGAVGQSRELRLRARFLKLDTATGEVAFHAIPYDASGCRRSLREAGLPAHSVHLRPSALGAGRRVLRALR